MTLDLPVLVPLFGVAGESVPMRDLRLPDLGVMFVLNGETSSLAIEAMFGRAASVGELWLDPASFGVTGLLAALSLELSAGVKGLEDCPLLVC